MRRSLLAALLAAGGCHLQTLERLELEPSHLRSAVAPGATYLKAHLKSGDVVIWSQWRVADDSQSVSGTGQRLDRNRSAVPGAEHTVTLDSVALFETNVLKAHGAIGGLTVVSVLSAAVSIACLANPKACFGSCPTFYLDEGSSGAHGAAPLISAEGFSASIAPALEASDIDALYRARPASRQFVLRMTNEALETHVVRWARLLAAPRPPGGRVYATQSGEFWASAGAVAPTRCAAAAGDCLGRVQALDDVEWFSVSDSSDLATRETIELEFPPVAGDTIGLVIGSRQTLLSTYVLYQMLARMGTEASGTLAALGRDSRLKSRADGIGRALGAIEVQALNARGRWETLGATAETGPLATDLRVVVLKRPPADSRRMRLRLTKGLWRIDHVALVALSARVTPVTLDPVRVLRGSVEDSNALGALRDSARTLVTLPGDEYKLEDQLPPDFAAYELFLESRGYYLEWMRQEWLAEQNVALARAMVRNPARALREMAPAFKKQEATMEQTFWNSRYVRH